MFGSKFFSASPLAKTKAVGKGTTVSLPEDLGPELAFIGRSNVGKSSLINALTGRKKLAVTSKTPGATRGIHFFTFGEGKQQLTLVDLPGYGFAKLPKHLAEKLSARVSYYLTHRPKLQAVYVLIDARRGLKEIDVDLIDYLEEQGLKAPVVLTKCDKVKPNPLQKMVKEMEAQNFEVFTSAALAGDGLNELRADIFRRAEDAK
jgi:GTP-binding protein